MRLAAAFLLLLTPALAHAKLVRHELEATRGSVDLSGRGAVGFALMINGSIPAPTLEFTEGDDAEIVVRNSIPNETLSLHWHGILLPNEMDGVPYLNTPPIHPGESFTFRFRIRQHGTYWYHSHTDVQEQKGLYGAFVIRPAKPLLAHDREAVAVLSDWSDEDGHDILANLRKDGDYYLYKKGTVRSWLGAIRAGKLGTYLDNEWTRMGGMDLSDVGYDAFLINGKREARLVDDARPGERVRLRIVNAAASSYFHVSLGDAPMKVVSADGVDIVPVMAKTLLMGMAETYDVIFEVPRGASTELRATAQDGTGTASAWIGRGRRVPAPDLPKPDLYAAMDHSAHAGHGAHAGPTVHESLTVDALRARESTAFPPEARRRELKLVLGGDMTRYVWWLNGKTIGEERDLPIEEGEVVRLVFENSTMMHHPLHLHGHFFRVLNDGGERSPLKHTVDVPPHATRVIEFRADEPGQWMLHCHNLYHMKTGMGRVVRYQGFEPGPAIRAHQAHDPHNHDHGYVYGTAEAATLHAQGSLRLSRTRDQFDLRAEGRNSRGDNLSFDDPWEAEGDLLYRRWFGQFLNLTGGATLFDRRGSAVAGVSYRLPMLIESQVLVTHRGQLRLDLEKRFQWTSALFTDVDVSWRPGQGVELGHDLEFEASLLFAPAWSWAAGLMLTEDGLGAGARIQF